MEKVDTLTSSIVISREEDSGFPMMRYVRKTIQIFGKYEP